MKARTTPAAQRSRRRPAWLCLILLLLGSAAPAPQPAAPMPTSALDEPITPIPQPPTADPRKLALGERLFDDHRLSHDGSFACSSCHDVHTNGADHQRHQMSAGVPRLRLNTLTIFNAALSFRLNWEGNFRTLEAQAESSLENSANLNTSVQEVLGKLNADPTMVDAFRNAYDDVPNRTNLLDAIATYERSLLTPGSPFDRWLRGDATALNAQELAGYSLFKSLGCVSCHQGVNVGANLYQRHGIFHPLASPQPEVLRVPSLRNVATTAPYFHDGSAPTLGEAVGKMAAAQLNLTVSDQQRDAIVAFLSTLTGIYHGTPVVAGSP